MKWSFIMPKVKPLLVIPTDFVEKVLNLIASESEAGLQLLVSLAKKAEDEYKKPIKSWFTGWLYWYTRTRGEEIDAKLESMQEDTPQKFDACERLKKFKALIIEHTWESGSYNVYLFRELIQVIPGYEPVQEELVVPFIKKLKDEIIDKMDAFIVEYNANQKLIAERKQDLDLTAKKADLHAKDILVFKDLTLAQDEAKQPLQTKIIFSLAKNKQEIWELFLLSSEGEAYPLNLTDELVRQIDVKNIQDVSKLNEILLKPIKTECIKAKNLFLARTQLLVNPPQADNKELTEKGINLTFVLRHSSEKVALFWFNSLSVSNEIKLVNYPKIKTWLVEHPAPLAAEDEVQLKLQLLNVKTSQALGSERIIALNSLKFKKKGLEPSVNKLQLDSNQFQSITQLLERRMQQMALQKSSVAKEVTPITKKVSVGKEESVVTEEASVPKPLAQDRYRSLTGLPTLWSKRKEQVDAAQEAEDFSMRIND